MCGDDVRPICVMWNDKGGEKSVGLGSLHKLLAQDPALGLVVRRGLKDLEHSRMCSELWGPSKGAWGVRMGRFGGSWEAREAREMKEEREGGTTTTPPPLPNPRPPTQRKPRVAKPPRRGRGQTRRRTTTPTTTLPPPRPPPTRSPPPPPQRRILTPRRRRPSPALKEKEGRGGGAMIPSLGPLPTSHMGAR